MDTNSYKYTLLNLRMNVYYKLALYFTIKFVPQTHSRDVRSHPF